MSNGQSQEKPSSFQQKPVWKQYALRNSMKRVVTVPRQPVKQKPPENQSGQPKKD